MSSKRKKPMIKTTYATLPDYLNDPTVDASEPFPPAPYQSRISRRHSYHRQEGIRTPKTSRNMTTKLNPEELRAFVLSNTIKKNIAEQPVGIEYFINFIIAHQEDINYAVDILENLVRQKAIQHSFNKVAIPQLTHDAFASMMADRLSIPYVLIAEQSVLLQHSLKQVHENDNILVLSDVALSGNTLDFVVSALRNQGATIEHAFVLVERTDKPELPSARLRRKYGVELHSALQIDEQELQRGLLELSDSDEE